MLRKCQVAGSVIVFTASDTQVAKEGNRNNMSWQKQFPAEKHIETPSISVTLSLQMSSLPTGHY